jgi:hypothetical protein
MMMTDNMAVIMGDGLVEQIGVAIIIHKETQRPIFCCWSEEEANQLINGYNEQYGVTPDWDVVIRCASPLRNLLKAIQEGKLPPCPKPHQGGASGQDSS